MSKKDKKRIAELEQDSRILSGKILNLQRNFELLFKDVKQEQARADIAVSQRFEALNMQFGIFKAGTIPNQTAKDSPTRDKEIQDKIDWGNAKLRNSFFGNSALNNPKQAEPKQGSDGADSPKQEPTFQSQLDQYHAELSDKIASEINKTMEFWAGVLGLRASKQDEPNQPEINHYDPGKAALNKIVLGRIEEMETWLGEREHSTTEIAQAIQTCVDNLGLDLADFRRKVLGTVEPCKVEPKETVHCEEKQQEEDKIWAVYNSETNLWLRRSHNNAYWQPASLRYSGFSSKEIAEGNIAFLHENGTLRARIEHCKAVVVAPKKAVQGKERQVFFIQNLRDERNNCYIEKIGAGGLFSHTTKLSDAKEYCCYSDAETAINNLILDGKVYAHTADDFKILAVPVQFEIEQSSEEKQCETEQPEWCIYNTKNNSLVFIGDGENCRYSSKQDAENAICRLHNSGQISGKFHDYDAVLVSEMIKQMEAKEVKAEQPSPEKDGEKQRVKQQFYLIQMNPKSAERFNAFYLEKLSTDGFAIHTPNPNEAMHLIDADAAQTEIDTIIKYGAGRYDADDFKIVEKP